MTVFIKVQRIQKALNALMKSYLLPAPQIAIEIYSWFHMDAIKFQVLLQCLYEILSIKQE